MAADELARLSRKLRASDIADESGRVILSDDFLLEETKTLPPHLRDDVIALAADVRAIVPSDFSISLIFEFDGVRIDTDLEDGNSGSFGMGGGGFFTSRKSMLKKLRSTRWDEIRGASMRHMDAFDEMVNAADDRPANIPSSEEAAKQYFDQLESVVQEVLTAEPKPPFALFVAREDFGGVGANELFSRDDLIRMIGNRMATDCDIVGVLENGRRWSFAEIESAKAEAVEGLPPISRARAERRFSI
jgi:hypothetical protein